MPRPETKQSTLKVQARKCFDEMVIDRVGRISSNQPALSAGISSALDALDKTEPIQQMGVPRPQIPPKILETDEQHTCDQSYSKRAYICVDQMVLEAANGPVVLQQCMSAFFVHVVVGRLGIVVVPS